MKVDDRYKSYQTGILGRYQFEKENPSNQRAILNLNKKRAYKRKLKKDSGLLRTESGEGE